MSDLFERSDPIVQELYESLLSKLKTIGPYKIESKKTSIHLVSRVAFLGVHPREGV